MAIPQDVQHTNEKSHQKVCAQTGESMRIPMSMEQRTRRQENYNTDRLSDFLLLSYVQFELISTVTVYHDM
jgi:hypothetical protein